MQGKRILIVDDEASLRTTLFRALDRKGYQVITSSTYKEAESVSQTDKALDLAILDFDEATKRMWCGRCIRGTRSPT